MNKKIAKWTWNLIREMLLLGEVYFVSANVPITYISQVPMAKWHTHSLVYQTKELAGKILEDVISAGDTAAVKVHFGERYTQSYIRPIYVRKVADKIKELGGKPFICDTCSQEAESYMTKSAKPFSLEDRWKKV